MGTLTSLLRQLLRYGRDERGVVLLVTLIFTAILLGISAMALFSGRANLMTSENFAASTRAAIAAESAIDEAVYRLSRQETAADAIVPDTANANWQVQILPSGSASPPSSILSLQTADWAHASDTPPITLQFKKDETGKVIFYDPSISPPFRSITLPAASIPTTAHPVIQIRATGVDNRGARRQILAETSNTVAFPPQAALSSGVDVNLNGSGFIDGVNHDHRIYISAGNGASAIYGDAASETTDSHSNSQVKDSPDDNVNAAGNFSYMTYQAYAAGGNGNGNGSSSSSTTSSSSGNSNSSSSGGTTTTSSSGGTTTSSGGSTTSSTSGGSTTSGGTTTSSGGNGSSSSSGGNGSSSSSSGSGSSSSSTTSGGGSTTSSTSGSSTTSGGTTTTSSGGTTTTSSSGGTTTSSGGNGSSSSSSSSSGGGGGGSSGGSNSCDSGVANPSIGATTPGYSSCARLFDMQISSTDTTSAWVGLQWINPVPGGDPHLPTFSSPHWHGTNTDYVAAIALSSTPTVLNDQPPTSQVWKKGVFSWRMNNLSGIGAIPSYPSTCTGTTLACRPTGLTPFPTFQKFLGLDDNSFQNLLAHPDTTSANLNSGKPPLGFTYVQGDLTFNNSTASPGTNEFGLLYVTGDLRINGNQTFKGLIFVDGSLQITGNPIILGAVMVRGATNSTSGTGNLTLLYSKKAVDLGLQAGHPWRVLAWKDTTF